MSPRLKADLSNGPGIEGVGALPYVDTAGAAEVLNVSQSYLNKARLDGSGPVFHKFGAAVRYSVPMLLKWAKAQQRISTSDSSRGAAA
jgi:hypothetical protein